METYIVFIEGSWYDENYHVVELCTTFKEKAVEYIALQKGRRMDSGASLYCYLQIWENGVKISETESEL